MSWHIPQKSLTSAIHQPSEEYIGKENIPQVQALDTCEPIGEVRAPYKSCQQDQAAETLKPVLPGIYAKSHKQQIKQECPHLFFTYPIGFCMAEYER